MSGQPSPFKIGLFVIVGALLGLGGALFLGARELFESKVRFETYFEESVQGLEVGAPVKFRGVSFGTVEMITMVGKEYATDRRYIMVRCTFRADVFRLKEKDMTEEDIVQEVDRGLRACLGFQGLTGSAYLALDYVDRDKQRSLPLDWKPRHFYIPSYPSTITRIGDALDRIMKRMDSIDVKGVTDDLRNSMDTLAAVLEGARLADIGGEATALLSELRRTNGRLEALLRRPEIDTILEDTSAAMAAARRLTADTERPVELLLSELIATLNETKTFIQKMNGFAEGMPEALADLRKTLNRLDNLISSQRTDIETAVGDLRETIENIRDLTEEAKGYPAGVFFGGPPTKTELEEDR